MPSDIGNSDWIALFFTGLTLLDFLHYLGAAGAAWLFFFVLRRKHWLRRKIVAGFAPWKDIRREICLSTLSCAIYGFVAVLTVWAVRQGWTWMYLDVKRYGWWWLGASFVLTVLVHDAYFYWTHRLMHWRVLFPLMHRSHHRSLNPTPWAAYAFDPLEAVVQAGIFPLVVFLYPIHPAAFLLFMAVQLGFNVIGHAGFEIFPHRFLDSPLGRFLNTPTNHAMHHQYFRGNYGLYFNFWDRLMGTNHRDYEARFREITAPGPALPETESGSAMERPAPVETPGE